MAQCILQKIRINNFLSYVVGRYQLLPKMLIYIINKIFSITYLVAKEHLKKLKETIVTFRTDEHFAAILKEASQMAQSLGIALFLQKSL